MEEPNPTDRLYDGPEGCEADPLYKLFRSFDAEVSARILRPMQRPHEETIHEKMMHLLSIHSNVRKQMFDLLNQLNHKDFRDGPSWGGQGGRSPPRYKDKTDA